MPRNCVVLLFRSETGSVLPLHEVFVILPCLLPYLYIPPPPSLSLPVTEAFPLISQWFLELPRGACIMISHKGSYRYS